MMEAESNQRVFADGGARNLLRDDDARQYVIAAAERVPRVWIDSKRGHDQPVVVVGSTS
jgi:hypothetical protein